MRANSVLFLLNYKSTLIKTSNIFKVNLCLSVTHK